MTEIPEWLTIGADVAVIRSDWRSNPQRPIYATVLRIGKRDVVLDDDQRFPVSRLERRDGGTWGWVVRLLPADEPVVQEALGAWQYQQIRYRAERACEDFRFGRNGTSAVDVILACSYLTGVAGEIAALFDRTTPTRTTGTGGGA